MPTVNIAIDGPAGAGKSTLARMLAKKLSYLYVDTGALYRAIGLFVLNNHISTKDRNQVVGLLKKIHIELKYENKEQKVFVNDTDVSSKIRTPEVSMAASDVSSIPEVRDFLLNLQKNIARENNVVMDGRDIGTVVLPHARVKIFLTASPEIRAKRRYEELTAKGVEVVYEDVLSDVIKRDKQDETREIAPLKPSSDAVIVDTTGLNIEQSLDKLISVSKEMLL